MQSEESIQVDPSFGNVDGGPHGVVSALPMWHHDIEPVGGAALEDTTSRLLRMPASIAPNAARVRKPGNGVCNNYGKSAIAKKNAACDGTQELRFQLSALSCQKYLKADG